jgi:hypothetical protein
MTWTIGGPTPMLAFAGGSSGPIAVVTGTQVQTAATAVAAMTTAYFAQTPLQNEIGFYESELTNWELTLEDMQAQWPSQWQNPDYLDELGSVYDTISDIAKYIEWLWTLL